MAGSKAPKRVFVIQIGRLDHAGEYDAISDVKKVYESEKDAFVNALHHIAFEWQEYEYEPDDVPLPEKRIDDPVRLALSIFLKRLKMPYPPGKDQDAIDNARLDELIRKLYDCKVSDLKFWFGVLSSTPKNTSWMAVTESTLC